MDDARAGGHDAEAAAGLRSQMLDLALGAEGLSYRALLEAAVDLLWRHDLNREVRGARAIAEAVYGDDSRQAVARVKKFERDGVCTFRRWGTNQTIYLLQGEVMRVRLELQAQGKLP